MYASNFAESSNPFSELRLDAFVLEILIEVWKIPFFLCIQGSKNIFSPVAFIAGLMETFQTHDLPDAGITVGSASHSVKISDPKYADDTALLDSYVH